MTGWNFSLVWDAVARTRPDGAAQLFDGRVTSWRAFETRAAGIAGALLAAGLPRQGKVALYLRNGPEYMEATYGALKAGMVPVNTNFRYGPEELSYLWDNADVEAVVFHAGFTPVIERMRDRFPHIRLWLQADEGEAARPDWAAGYEDAATCGARPEGGLASGDDVILIYTGGTTGMPKGVMWRQHDLYRASNASGDGPEADMAAVEARIRAAATFPVGLSAAPLMHGTGFVFAATILNRGGTLLTLPDRRFSAEALLDAMTGRAVTDLCIVGDAFARPMTEALDAAPNRWDLSRLRVVSSSGMAWSEAVKERLLAHAPNAMLIDFLNSSEASGMGRSISSRRAAGRKAGAGRFRLGENAFVIDEAGAPMAPGDPRAGRLAVRGHVPLGYYKDPEKTAATFPVIDGARCAVPGDFAKVLADGEIVLLGRGSTSINTGGEKVFADEVEATIKTHPGVRDALVLGMPDERFGETVAALVEAGEGDRPDEQAIINHVRDRLAAYKAPRRVMVVSDLGRTVTGKADYPAAKARLAEWLRAQPQQRS